MQHAPSNARQLVGERNRQHVVVKPPGRGLDPRLEAIALPVAGPRAGRRERLARTAFWRYLLPRLDILPRIVRSPVEICFGTRPSQAPKSRPLQNTSPVPIAATAALEIIGPMPGTVINRSQPVSSWWASTPISSDTLSMRSSSRRQSPMQVLDEVEQARGRARRCAWRGCPAARVRSFYAGLWRTAIPRSSRKARISLAIAGALADQARAHPMQGPGGSSCSGVLVATKRMVGAAPPRRWLPRRGNRSCGP